MNYLRSKTLEENAVIGKEVLVTSTTLIISLFRYIKFMWNVCETSFTVEENV